MKKIVFLILMIGLSPILEAQNSDVTTFILIRHAEKAKEGGKDPMLNAVGKKRAARLSEVLADTKIDKIISTPFKRTMNTVKHIALKSYVEVETYDYRNQQLLEELVEKNKGKTILISGHSNTTPFLVNKLIGTEKYQQLDETEYDKIFIVSCTKVGDGKVVTIKY